MFAPWSNVPDGCPLKPLWTSVADSPPVLDAAELVAATRHFLTQPTIPATAGRAEFDQMTKKAPGPEVGPVAAEFCWPTYVFNAADLEDNETGGKEKISPSYFL